MKKLLIIPFLFSICYGQLVTNKGDIVDTTGVTWRISIDSSLWQTKFRSDTSRINIYTSLAGKQAIGNYAIADSTLWQTKFRTDSMRTNIYSSLSGKLSIATAASTYLPFAGGTMTGIINLVAGTASVAPIGFQSGPLLTSPSIGKVEFLTDAWYGTITTGTARKTFAFLESPSFTTPSLGVATATSINGNIFTAGSSTYTGVASQTYNMPVTGGNIAKIPTSGSVSGSDVTNTTVTLANITGMSVAVEASKKYRVTAVLLSGQDNTGGTCYAIAGPASSAVLSGTWTGTSTAATTPIISKVSAMGVSSATSGSGAAFNRFITTEGKVILVAYITTAGTAGNIILQFRSVTATQTSTVFIGSTIDVTEVQ